MACSKISALMHLNVMVRRRKPEYKNAKFSQIDTKANYKTGILCWSITVISIFLKFFSIRRAFQTGRGARAYRTISRLALVSWNRLRLTTFVYFKILKTHHSAQVL